jgi:hypothetical protein
VGASTEEHVSFHFNIMSNYEQLHRQCRTLENLFDTKLTSYSQLVSTLSRPSEDVEAAGSRERWKDLELEAEELLEKVRLRLAMYGIGIYSYSVI